MKLRIFSCFCHFCIFPKPSWLLFSTTSPNTGPLSSSLPQVEGVILQLSHSQRPRRHQSQEETISEHGPRSGGIVSPPKRRVHTLTPGTLHMTLFEERVFVSGMKDDLGGSQSKDRPPCKRHTEEVARARRQRWEGYGPKPRTPEAGRAQERQAREAPTGQLHNTLLEESKQNVK